jgi:Domain of unknown function (DUF4389)
MSSTVMGGATTTAVAGSYPIDVTFERQPSYSRLFAVPVLGLAIRFVALIPHFIALYIVAAITALIHYVAWIPVLFSGNYPGWAYSWSSGTVRWATRVGAYYFGLTDKYPPFSLSGNDNYPVQVNIEAPTNPGRFFAIPLLGYAARFILLIPSLIAVYVVYLIVAIFQLFLWIPVLFGGQYPDIGFSVVGGFVRWGARIYGYLYGLTDKYPPFSLSS